MYHHYVIDGRIFRVLELEAADRIEAARHISAQRPIGFTAAKEIRQAVSR